VVAALSSKLPGDDDCVCGMHATRAFAALSLFLSNSISLEKKLKSQISLKIARTQD
jgi:hypothetical protein